MNRLTPHLQRSLILSLVAALLIVLIPPALAQGGPDAQVVTPYLNMRTQPSTSAPLVQRLSYGTLLTAEGRNADGSWLYVRTGAGVTGWVATNWVAIRIGLDIGSLPVTNASGTAAPAEAVAALSAPAGETPVISAPAAQQPAVQPQPTGSFNASVTTRLNLRVGPGTQYRRLGVMAPGTQVALQARDASGQWVYGATNTGMTGWMAASYLSTGVAIGSLPVNDGSAPVSGAPAAPQPSQPQPQPQAPAPSTAPGGFILGGQIRGYSYQGWMQTAGMTWVKQQISYSPGMDPNGSAGLINEAHARGFRILLSVTGHPEFIYGDPNYIQNYSSYVAGLAALGADGIEVRNEMNIDREWPTGRIDPGFYTQLLVASYNAIKARNPATLVISGAPAPTGAEGFFGSDRVWNDDRYIRGMAAAGAANYADCIGVHYNEGIIPPGQRSGDPRGGHYTRYFWGMVDTYWNAFGGQRPLCFTELGYLSAEGYGPLPGGFAWAQGVTVAQQAAWLAEAVRLARSSGRVRMVIVWNVDYTGTWGEDPQGGYAIVRPDGSCPACQALAAVR